METRYFQTLVRVAETGSFSRAAEALNITQSAVSQRIKFLEQQYGHQLLDRSGPALVPTKVGSVVLEKARGILAQERELLEGIRKFDGGKRLSLCCTPTFGMAYLPGVLNDFMLQNADVADLTFIFHQPRQALDGLRSGQFDLAIIEHCDDYDMSALRSRDLPRDELVFISAAASDFPPSPFPCELLLPHRLYARRDGCSSKQLLRHNLARQGSSMDAFASVVISDDLRYTIEAVLDGGGISFVSSALVASHLRAGRIRAHHVEGFNHYRRRTALFRRDRESEPLVQNLLGCVAASFARRAEALAAATAPFEAEPAAGCF